MHNLFSTIHIFSIAQQVSSYIKVPNVFIPDVSNWVTVKLNHSNDSLKVYFNDSLLVKYLFTDTIYRVFKLQQIFKSSVESGSVDYLKVYDQYGQLQYIEEFEDCKQSASNFPPSLRCSDSCQASFATYYNTRKGTTYSYSQIDSIYFLTCGIHPNPCMDTAITSKKLEQVQKDFYANYLNPGKQVVDLDMRTLSGNKTSDKGPKGVFDINNNLIANTVDGTTDQIKQSFATIWNSSPANQTVGTLSALITGKFRLTLLPGKTMPCQGIIGMRYYQFDSPNQSIDGILCGPGSYIDFGDSSQSQVELFNSNTNTGIYRYGGNDSLYTSIKGAGFYVTHIFPSAALRTITVYHSDIRGYVGFDNWGSSASSLSNIKSLRGYIPDQTVHVTFHSTQDSTINTFNNISNKDSLMSLKSIHFLSGDVGITPILNYNFAPFVKSPNLQFAWCGADTVSIESILPNIPVNFKKLSHLESKGVNYNDSVKLIMPLATFVNIQYGLLSYQVDSILNQLGRSVTLNNGSIYLAYGNQPRTTASDAAVTTLQAKGWYVFTNDGSAYNPIPIINLYDTLPAETILYSEFTDYVNSQLYTNLTLKQINKLYQQQCGYIPDPCNAIDNGPTLCGKLEPVFPVVKVNQWGPCDDSTNFAIVKGTQLYEAYRDSLNDNFSEAYYQKCLNAQKLESFTVTAPVSEYHYTLYYYGQAGNLIKTVPPQGVDVSKFTNNNWSDTVANARKNNQIATPNHTLKTIYRYNTLNQVVAQQTPDAGKSEFWYDRLGRLVISQNAKQKNYYIENGRSYSYTLYDYIGRITEVGEYINPSTTAMTDALSRNQTGLNTWLNTLGNRSQITSTVYDLEYPGWVAPKQLYPRNLRNRVAYTKYTIGSNTLAYNQATFYSYDIHGNVDTLVQDYGRSDTPTTANMMNLNNNRWKKMVYKYDLISGKVNHVAYQPQYVNPADNKLYIPNDAMYHKYEYDAENRLTAVYTSTDSVIWEKDARYEYYKHGPLARTTIGDQLVQGIDYAYTLQGWLKGVNSTSLQSDYDIGGDGNGTAGQNQNQYVAKDAFGFNLNYYTQDYNSINATVSPFPGSNGAISSAYRPLYNGNISSMAVNINNLTIPGGVANAGGAMLYNYKYDQLNRITQMDAYTGLSSNSWTGITLKNEYKERVAYDANGNILKYLRNGNKTASIVMDSLGYKYYANTNQLSSVTDNVSASAYTSPDADIDNQSANNYTYDLIGNLATDTAEHINSMAWNVYGKITTIGYSNTAANTIKNIYYFYDASGNRIGKLAQTNVASGNTSSVYTWYVRDASGNVMATYTSTADGNSYPSNLAVSERHLYGSSRLGIFAQSKDVKTTPSFTIGTLYKTSFTRGYKYYELTNHLGNVLATISDKKVGHNPGSGIIDYYTADVVSANDYYPFGMMMPGRKYSVANTNYRYGFNGKEMDRETTGTTTYDYGFRIYSPGLGKFLSVDPLTEEYPWNSTYAFAENDVIRAIDIEGAEKYIKTNYKNVTGLIYKTSIQCITNNQTGKAIELNFHNAVGKLTTYDVYESDQYDNGKIVDIKRDKNYRNKLSSDEIKILNKQKNMRSQSDAPKESDPFENNLQFENFEFQKGVYSSDIFDGDENIAKEGSEKVSQPKPKITLPKTIGSPLPVKTTSTSSFSSSINFWGSTASTQGSIKSEISDVVNSLNGKSDYSITIYGNFNGTSDENFSTKANILARANGYKTYGDLALARANRIKEKLVAAGLDASKITTTLGNPQAGMNADYKITTTTVK